MEEAVRTDVDAFPRSVIVWLEEWAECVRNVDFRRARELFAEDVSAFGTRNHRLEGLDDLERRQWRVVWPHTEGFRFDLETARAEVAADGRVATVIAEWSSTGFRETDRFDRSGRATIVLRRIEAAWKATHTHFSMAPDVPADSWRHVPRPSSSR